MTIISRFVVVSIISASLFAVTKSNPATAAPVSASAKAEPLSDDAKAAPLSNDAKAAPFSSFAIGAEIGTTGIGVQISTPLWQHYLNLTAGYSGFGLTYHGSQNGQSYTGNLRLGGAPIFLSGYPFRGLPFSFDAGLFINQNRIDVSAKPDNGLFVFNRHHYPKIQLGPVDGKTHWNSVAPYFGVGWGDPFRGGRWKLTANVGVILEGGADARLSATNENRVPGAAENIKVFESRFDDHVNFLSAFPVVNIGLDYRF